MNEVLSQEELAERVAIVKRFRSLLEKQRTKFQEYLKALELQETKISSQDTEALMAHTELETQIVQGIDSLRKVIGPMQKLYLGVKSSAATYNPADIVPIDKLQNDLHRLQSQVLAQNEKNRQMIKVQLSELREQIVAIKNPYRSHQSIYADVESGNLIQIEA